MLMRLPIKEKSFQAKKSFFYFTLFDIQVPTYIFSVQVPLNYCLNTFSLTLFKNKYKPKEKMLRVTKFKVDKLENFSFIFLVRFAYKTHYVRTCCRQLREFNRVPNTLHFFAVCVFFFLWHSKKLLVEFSLRLLNMPYLQQIYVQM